MTRPAPTTQEEWFRDVERRFKALENPQAVRVGSVVLTARDGVLVVSDGTGQAFTVSDTTGLALPTPAEIGAVSKADVALSIDPPPDGTPLSWLTQLLTGKWGGIDTAQDTGDNAQYTADNAYATAAAVEARLNAGASGYYFTDTFDGDFATDLGTEYFRTTVGSGGGTYRSDATGLAHQTVPGTSLPQTWIDRHVTATATLNQQVTTILNSVPNAAGGVGTEPARHTLMAHMNAANADRIEGRVENGFCAIGYTIASTYTEIDSRGIAMVGGDRWDIVTDATTHAFILLRNNLPALRFDDVGHVYPLDASHMFAGMANKAGTVVSFFLTAQTNAPEVQSLNISDRT